jgi:flagellar basal body-associated protein FliL
MTNLLNLPRALTRLILILLAVAIVGVSLALFAVSYWATRALVGLSDWLKNTDTTTEGQSK